MTRFRSTVGFDRMMNAREGSVRSREGGRPFCNIEKKGGNSHCVTMAIACFGDSDLEIAHRHGVRIDIRGSQGECRTSLQFCLWPGRQLDESVLAAVGR